MQASFLLLIANSNAGISGPVFWLLVIAAILWYLIWLLLHRGSNSVEKSSPDAESATAAGTVATSAADAGSSRSNDSEVAPGSSTGAAANVAGTSATAASAATASSPETATISDSGEPSEDPPVASPEIAPEAPVLDSQETASSQPSDTDDQTSEDTASGEPEEEPLPEIETASAEQAGEQFKAEIESGNARLDENFGVVFTAAPDKADDLKKIKGVGKVLEGKLNEHGVYTYRQIAFWTDSAVKEFSKMLTSFKDRIYRDNWIAQAKTLHEKHHGEKL